MRDSNKFPKTSTWEDFSDRLCKILKLPTGSRFCLVNKSGRVKRKETKIRRKYLKKSEIIDSGTEDSNLASVFVSIKKLLSHEVLMAHELAAKGPTGETLNGNTKIKTWRQMPPASPKGIRLERQWIEFEIRDEIAPQAKASIYSALEGIEDAERKVPQAYMLALLEYFEKEHVLAACKYAGILR